jgi:hypothetical protein
VKQIRRCLALGVIASASGCLDQNPVSPDAQTIIVHAILDASAHDQYVLVQTTEGRTPTQKIVSGATVVLLTPDGHELRADEVLDSAYAVGVGQAPAVNSYYRISLDKYGVALTPGSTYRLRITLPDGREVSGSTMIPGAPPPVSFDLPASLAATDSLVLAWPRVTGAIAYDVSVSLSGFLVYETFADTSIVLSNGRTATGRGGLYSGSANHILVSAVDANYYDYYRRGSDPLTGAGPITHLTGAVGVFGSVVPIASGTLTVR